MTGPGGISYRVKKYRCTETCLFATDNPERFMDHIQGCEHVAHWIGEWAIRMKARNDWADRVGIRHGQDLGVRGL